MGDLVCQNVEFEILVRYTYVICLDGERNDNSAVIFSEFPGQLPVITDDEGRLILKMQITEKCPDTILGLFDSSALMLQSGVNCVIIRSERV